MSLTGAPTDKFLSTLKQSGLLDELSITSAWEEFRKAAATGIASQADTAASHTGTPQPRTKGSSTTSSESTKLHLEAEQKKNEIDAVRQSQHSSKVGVGGDDSSDAQTGHPLIEVDSTCIAFAEWLVKQGKITTWHATKLLKGKHKGFFLGKYKLLRLLGRGGMSSVYLAEHTVMKRQCAIKVLPYKLVADSSYLARFYREAQAVAALDHPNIIRAYDVDHQTDGEMEIHFLVMEFVNGRNFYELVKTQGPLQPRTAADYIRQGALGLQHAHESGMVHRDVKPGNFIVDANGTVKLMDLGLAMVHEKPGELSVTLANEEKVLGTADYLAPEQAVDSHLVDSRADLYALGCTFYFLLTGRPPFNEGSLTQRLLAHQSQTPPSLAELRSEIPLPLVELIERMMIKDPQQRIQTAALIAEELEHWLDHPDSVSEETDPGLFHFDSQADALPQQGGAISDFLAHLEEAETRAAGAGETSKNVVPRKSTAGQSSKTQAGKGSSASQRSSDSATSIFHSGPSSIVKPRQGSQRARKPLKPNLQSKSLFASILVVSVLLGLLAIYMLSAPKRTEPEVVTHPSVPDQKPAPIPQIQIEGTTIHVGQQGDFRTLGEAISYLENRPFDDTAQEIREIRLTGGETFTESVNLVQIGFGRLPRGLRIQGDAAQLPVLKGEGAAILSLDSMEQLTFANLIIDCSGLSVGVELTGYLSGVSFENVRFQNFSQSAIRGQGVAGMVDSRVSFRGCRFESGAATATAVRFEESALAGSRQIQFLNCRFIGPMLRGLTFHGSGGSTWDVEIEQSLFHETQTGIQFSGKDHDVSRVKIANNTFHAFQRGIHFENGPSVASTGISMVQNLFVSEGGAEVVLEQSDVSLSRLFQGGLAPQGNWTTGSRRESESWLDIFSTDGRTEVSDLRLLSTDPGSPDFLKPGNSELRTGKAPLFGRNYIGAVAP